MNPQNEKEMNDVKEMYVLNLDLTRVFWIIAVSLVILTFSFLFGFFIGSNIGYKNKNTISQHESKSELENRILDKGETTPANTNNISDSDQIVANNTNQSETTVVDVDENQNNNNYEQRTNDNSTRTRTRAPRRNSTPRSNTTNRSSYRDSKLTANKPFAIQVSFHKIQRNAHHVYDILKFKRFPAYIFQTTNSNGEEIYFVRVGPFRSESDAQRIRAKIRKDKEGRGAFIVNR